LKKLKRKKIFEDHATNWRHDSPKNYYFKMVEVFGEPDSGSERMVR
jgi:hypothetical protein